MQMLRNNVLRFQKCNNSIVLTKFAKELIILVLLTCLKPYGLMIIIIGMEHLATLTMNWAVSIMNHGVHLVVTET